MGVQLHRQGGAKLMQIFTNSTYGEMPVWQGGPGNGTMIGYKE